MIKKWLIRGDTHGNFNWMDTAGLTLYNPEETGIIILGDAGYRKFGTCPGAFIRHIWEK